MKSKVRPRARSEAPTTRCPYCHDGCSAEQDNVVCRGCLARHHRACWEEGSRCASCAAAEPMVPGKVEPATPEERPLYDEVKWTAPPRRRPSVRRALILAFIALAVAAPLLLIDAPVWQFTLVGFSIYLMIQGRRAPGARAEPETDPLPGADQ